MIRSLRAGAAALLLLTSAGAAEEPDAAGPPDWLKALQVRGRLKEEFAYRLHDPGDVSKIKTIAWLDGKYTFSEAVRLRIEGRGWWDGVFEASDRYPENVERDQKTDLALRQALLSVSAGPLDLRLGRQQIVWGEAIGTFITDVVNPRDLREFVLPEFTEIRIPLWALDVTYMPRTGLVLEGVWTPDLRFSKIPEPGAEFEFSRPPPPPDAAVTLRPEKKPALTLRNSQGGVRVSYLVSGWDLALFYYDAFDHTPVLFRRQTGTLPDGRPVITLTPRHPRLHIAGGTLGKSIEPFVLRGEAAFTAGKRYETRDLQDQDGVVRRDTFDYLLGVDYTFFAKLETTLQFSQKILAGPANEVTRGAVEARVTSSVALRLTTGFFDNTLNPTLLWVVNTNRADYRLSPKIEYLPTGSIAITLGADFFAGPRKTLYGQFRSNDRLYLEVDWKF